MQNMEKPEPEDHDEEVLTKTLPGCLEEQQIRLNILSGMSQVQRRNIELVQTLYTWNHGKHDEPSFPETLRATALEKIVDGLKHLEQIDAEMLKLL